MTWELNKKKVFEKGSIKNYIIAPRGRRCLIYLGLIQGAVKVWKIKFDLRDWTKEQAARFAEEEVLDYV